MQPVVPAEPDPPEPGLICRIAPWLALAALAAFLLLLWFLGQLATVGPRLIENSR